MTRTTMRLEPVRPEGEEREGDPVADADLGRLQELLDMDPPSPKVEHEDEPETVH